MVLKFLNRMQGGGLFKSFQCMILMWNFKRTKKAPSWVRAAYRCIHPRVNLLKDKLVFKDSC